MQDARRWIAGGMIALTLLLTACGGGDGGGASSATGASGATGSGTSASSNNGAPGANLNLPPGDGVFTATPIDLNLVTRLDPLGWINPPGGHTLPTDHVYFYFNGPWPQANVVSPAPVLPVVAPGSGTVVLITTSTAPPYDSSIMVRMTGTFVYYLAHVIPEAGIAVGTRVTAGQPIAHTNGAAGANAVDMGVIDERVTLTGFVNPARYLWQQIHCVAPWPYFTQPLRSQLEARVLRTGTDRNGRIDVDVPGTLQGNWFHESVPVNDSQGPAAWPKQLAFVPDPQEPSERRVSISSYLPLPGKWVPAAGTPAFAAVTVASGKVAFPLEYIEGHNRAGLMIVQLLDETHLKVQVFPGSLATDANFDAGAQVYSR